MDENTHRAALQFYDTHSKHTSMLQTLNHDSKPQSELVSSQKKSLILNNFQAISLNIMQGLQKVFQQLGLFCRYGLYNQLSIQYLAKLKQLDQMERHKGSHKCTQEYKNVFWCCSTCSQCLLNRKKHFNKNHAQFLLFKSITADTQHGVVSPGGSTFSIKCKSYKGHTIEHWDLCKVLTTQAI